jgi:hypothetical protein
LTQHDNAGCEVGKLKEFLGHNVGAGVRGWQTLGNASIAQRADEARAHSCYVPFARSPLAHRSVILVISGHHVTQ